MIVLRASLQYSHGPSNSRSFEITVNGPGTAEAAAELLLSAVEKIEEHEHQYPERVRKLDTETR